MDTNFKNPKYESNGIKLFAKDEKDLEILIQAMRIYS